MAQHQFDPNANKLWAYFVSIITWIRSTFPKYRREMKGLDWGAMFDEFGEGVYDTDVLEKQIHDLMEDDEIMKKSGIYRYVLSEDLRDLSFRTFDKKQKREAYERQKRNLRTLWQTFRVGRNGSRPHHPLERGRYDCG